MTEVVAGVIARTAPANARAIDVVRRVVFDAA
jgi:hypothetical protein